MALIADVFLKFRTPKHMVRSMPKKSRIRGPVEKQHGESAQTLLKFEGQLFHHIYWSLGRQLSYKKSLLQIWKMSTLFPHTLSADSKYSLLDRDNLTQRIKMLLYQKQKNFSEFFSSFFKSSLNLENLQKKGDPHRWCLSKIMDSQKNG